MLTVILTVLVLVYKSFCSSVCSYAYANKASCCCCCCWWVSTHPVSVMVIKRRAAIRTVM